MTSFHGGLVIIIDQYSMCGPISNNWTGQQKVDRSKLCGPVQKLWTGLYSVDRSKFIYRGRLTVLIRSVVQECIGPDRGYTSSKLDRSIFLDRSKAVQIIRPKQVTVLNPVGLRRRTSAEVGEYRPTKVYVGRRRWTSADRSSRVLDW